MRPDVPHIPALHSRLSIEAEQLPLIDDPCVIFEDAVADSDGVMGYHYSVGGFLAGEPVGGGFGVRVGDEWIVVHAKSRAEADQMAYEGLMTTIESIRGRNAFANPGNAGVGAEVVLTRSRAH